MKHPVAGRPGIRTETSSTPSPYHDSYLVLRALKHYPDVLFRDSRESQFLFVHSPKR